MDLTSFDYEVHRMIENGSQFEYAETCIKKFVKSHQVNLFLAGLSERRLTSQAHSYYYICSLFLPKYVA